MHQSATACPPVGVNEGPSSLTTPGLSGPRVGARLPKLVFRLVSPQSAPFDCLSRAVLEYVSCGSAFHLVAHWPFGSRVRFVGGSVSV